MGFDEICDFLIAFPDSRLTLLKFLVLNEGPKTVITNWKQVVKNLDQKYVKKFLGKKLATNTNIKGDQLILSGIFSQKKLNDLLRSFAEKYIICPLCQKPDTHLEKRGKKFYLICEAEGSEHVVPALN